MKSKDIRPTGIERELREGDYIVSTTDLAGRITSVNPVFVEFSGFSEEQLLSRPHNIIRHPDMPRAVFWLAWEAIRNGDDFQGYVKNMARDGSHYWVFAHIRPEYDEGGRPTGYRSVRRRPRREAVLKAAELYARMRSAEELAGPAKAVQAGLEVLRETLAARGQSYEEFVSTL